MSSAEINSALEQPIGKRRRVLVFRIGSMGDALIALPGLKALRREEPEAEIIYLTNAPVGGGVKAAPGALVLQGSGTVDSYLEFKQSYQPLHLLRLIFALRRLNIDRVVYLMPLRPRRARVRDALFLRLAGCRKVSGIDASSSERKRIFLLKKKHYESEASRLLRVVGGNPITWSEADFSLNLSNDEIAASARFLPDDSQGAQRIVVSIGTKSPANDWGQVSWLKLLRLIGAQQPRAFLILIGSKDEEARSEALRASFYDRSINLCGKLKPRESAAVIAASDLFIGHDSGPMHLAASVATPLIGIFSARNLPGIWFPFGASAHVFYNQLECAGCGLEVCTEQAMRCIRGIQPEAVAEKALLVLKERADTRRARQLSA